MPGKIHISYYRERSSICGEVWGRGTKDDLTGQLTILISETPRTFPTMSWERLPDDSSSVHTNLRLSPSCLLRTEPLPLPLPAPASASLHPMVIAHRKGLVSPRGADVGAPIPRGGLWVFHFTCLDGLGLSRTLGLKIRHLSFKTFPSTSQRCPPVLCTPVLPWPLGQKSLALLRRDDAGVSVRSGP